MLFGTNSSRTSWQTYRSAKSFLSHLLLIVRMPQRLFIALAAIKKSKAANEKEEAMTTGQDISIAGNLDGSTSGPSFYTLLHTCDRFLRIFLQWSTLCPSHSLAHVSHIVAQRLQNCFANWPSIDIREASDPSYLTQLTSFIKTTTLHGKM